MTRFPAIGGDSNRQIASKDRAETFTESDVSTSLTRVEIAGESLSLTTGAEDTINLSLSAESTGLREAGPIIQPKVPITGVRVTLNGLVSGSIDEARLEDSTGTILDSKSASGGDTVTLNASMNAGENYKVYGYSSTDFSANIGNSSYSSNKFGIVSGHREPGPNGSVRLVDSVTVIYPNSSGSAIVEWPQPSDVYRWDAASFQTTPDGETVQVYVEADDGSGWTEIAGPIDRGDQIDAPPDSQVRFRVELSRSDLSNNPTLDAIYRRWVV